MMYTNWIIPLLLFPLKVCSFNANARIATWSMVPDDVGDMIRMISRDENTANFANISSEGFLRVFDESDVDAGKVDNRIGIKVKVKQYVDKFNKPATLGRCTLGQHTYQGDAVYIQFPQSSYKYGRRADRLQTHEYTDVMGGVSISVFGLFGASVEARVQKTVQRDTKSLLIYSHVVIKKGVISLTNARVGSNWKKCKNVDKHYYLRDILTGMEDYLLVQMKFSSEFQRKKVEAKIKVKILFFSITKTITKIKTDYSSDFSLSIARIKTFPEYRIESRQDFSNIESGLQYIKSLEANRQNLPKLINDANTHDPKLHLEYFFQPCTITPLTDILPFKPAGSFMVTELIDRTNEMKSVQEDINNLIAKGNPKPTTNIAELNKLQKDIVTRLAKISGWQTGQISGSYVLEKLVDLYGPDRAPYYYERKLKMFT